MKNFFISHLAVHSFRFLQMAGAGPGQTWEPEIQARFTTQVTSVRRGPLVRIDLKGIQRRDINVYIEMRFYLKWKYPLRNEYRQILQSVECKPRFRSILTFDLQAQEVMFGMGVNEGTDFGGEDWISPISLTFLGKSQKCHRVGYNIGVMIILF